MFNINYDTCEYSIVEPVTNENHQTQLDIVKFVNFLHLYYDLIVL